MDNQVQQAAKKRNLVFALAAASAVLIVGAVGFFILSNIKNEQSAGEAMSQEQFQTTPELSSALQAECQQSAVKISKLSNNQDLEQEYKSHAEGCREVYFAFDDDSPFRKEGMYGDLVVDLAHHFAKSDKTKAVEILNYAKTLSPWEFYLGPVSCESHHVLDAYLESLNLPTEKQCIKISDYKAKLIPELENKKYEILKSMLSNADVVWMGQPESDVGCPEKITSVISVMNRLTPDAIKVEEPKQEISETNDLVLALQSDGVDKVALVFRPENDCLQVRSMLVPNLEVSE